MSAREEPCVRCGFYECRCAPHFDLATRVAADIFARMVAAHIDVDGDDPLEDCKYVEACADASVQYGRIFAAAVEKERS